MTTKTAQAARVDLFAGLKDLQKFLHDAWIDRSIPKDWDFMEDEFPAQPKKMKLTLTLDEDMVRWFRKLGRGYQARMNAVLRIYWKGLISGVVKSHWDETEVGPQQLAYTDARFARMLEAFQEFEDRGGLPKGSTDNIREDHNRFVQSLKALM